jgi:hypothetical protein
MSAQIIELAAAIRRLRSDELYRIARSTDDEVKQRWFEARGDEALMREMTESLRAICKNSTSSTTNDQETTQ